MQLITQGLSLGAMVNGLSPRTVTLLPSEASCVNTKLPAPANGNVAALPVGNVTCATATGPNYLAGPNFKNKLLTQTIALTLNVRLQPALGNLQLTGPYIITYAATACSSGVAVPNTQASFAIPPSVLTCLGINNTVNNLITLANQTLGNASSCSATLQNIHDAVKAVNLAFDHCRILARFSATPLNGNNGAREDEGSEDDINLSMLYSYPNPFSDYTNVEFTSEYDAYVTVEVFNAIGQKVTSLFKGDVKAGHKNTFLFDSQKYAEGMYIVRVGSNSVDYYHKMMLSR